ncbi:hypothetical protein D9Q98_006003 [Chlorella vulgaris]|uniref:Thiaminase-2/PQQC domain-containing protein n=1 Tax=Chlorella vulgaris TaxID=3077 RepID=A0A9D4TWS4_CHLVU|nr:hypothetical protein D9Q98_006003 [Chlorella vulgaris]
MTVSTPSKSDTDAPAAPAAPAEAAGAAKPHAASLPLPPSTMSCKLPGTFCAELWSSVNGIFSQIMSHAFLTQLADGSLEEATFKFYIVQGALYLREYARALALVASKAPRAEWVAFFSKAAHDAFLEESSFHKEFLAYFDTTVKRETASAELAPFSLLYTSTVLATVHGQAFYEALAAVLPCFVVYLEVGKALLLKGSPHPLYQKFIDRFAGTEYEQLTLSVVEMANAVAAEAGEAGRRRMQRVFEQGTRMEWMFFDAAYQCQTWPV